MSPNFKKVVERSRSAFNSGRTLSLEFRKQQMKQLLKLYEENQQDFIEALKSDVRKPKMEAFVFEVNAVKSDVTYILRRLDKWAAPDQVPSQIPLDKSLILKEPYGVALVIGAWNFPLQLTMVPVHGALAAGNTVIIKPSETAPATASLIAKLVPHYLDKECYQVVCGGVSETTALLQQRFDYIFYTGSTHVGRIVREASNKYLTPTTLEMGGKSPCYIDNTINMDLVARRILWGKMTNLGQICVAPDYLLCSKAVQGVFIAKAREVLLEWYGKEPQKSPDLSRIVTDRHVDRLVSYLECGKAVIGGRFEKADRWVEPTVLVNVTADSKVMTEEIFGPILPIINVENHVEAIEFIKRREKPLALYIFTQEEEVQQTFLKQVSAGGVTINDVLLHIGNNTMPFGGVGESGMGMYHGKYTFDTFSHHKSCLVRTYNSLIEKGTRNRFPPYTEKKMKFMVSQKDQGDGPGIFHYLCKLMEQLFTMGFGAIILYLVLKYTDAY
ncbi:aldehyde dehydrogenase, dimeric NADP-preferring-like isoform X2 [Scylla paramamosain]|uniref:aldehyde dehydrogenase, dimeric NADP-preferring-like isoform X2 n=1 Tax=Scylla paramamosain TaxID=85552 RepID=UPI003083CC9D